MTIDYTKLLALLLVVAGSIFLTAAGHLESEACVALLGAALGYVFGNGHGVAEARTAAETMRQAVAAFELKHGPGEGGGLHG